MLYNFKPEDRQFYELLEALDIIPHLETFLANHKLRIKEAFENMLDEIKREEKNEWNTRFIQEMDCEQFIYVVEFTFCVIFSKDMVRLSRRHNDTVLSALSAHSLAEKMSKDAQNVTYVGQIERVISNCCNSILSSYRNAPE